MCDRGGSVGYDKSRDAKFIGRSPGLGRVLGDRFRSGAAPAFAAALAVTAFVVLGTATPALAADSVGAAHLQLSSLAPSATDVSYTAVFVATDGLTDEFSSIELAAPAGTVFPGSGVTCNTDYVYDYTNDTGGNCGKITVSNSGATLSYVENNIDINAGDVVGIVATGVTNPASSGTLKLSTSSDPTTVSLSETLSSSGTIGAPNYQQSSYTPSATPVTDTASFVATDGLTATLSTVTLAAPSGTVFPGSGVTCDTDYVYDDTTSQTSNCGDITVSNSGATLSYIENNININSGDEITVVATGVTNAAASGTLKISTSSDPTARSVTTGAATSGPANLQIGSYTPSATETTYQVNFTTTHGFTGGTTQITLAAPSGTDFGSTSDCYDVIDDTTDSFLCATASGTGTDTLVLSTPTVAAGAEVTVIVPDVTNDTSASSQNLTVSDTADSTVATLPYTLSSTGKSSDASLELNTLSASAKQGTYTTSFVSTDALDSDGSTVTLAAPSGTVFTGTGSVCSVYYVWDATKDTGDSCVTASTSNSGATVTITMPIDVSAGDVVTIVADGVTNNAVTTAQSLAITTTSDPTAQSVAYTLVKKRAVSGASLELSSYAKSAKDVTYRASFDSVDGLTDGHSTITLAAPAGTVFDGSGSVCSVIYVYDDTNGSGNDCVDVTQSHSGATITVTLSIEIGIGDEVSVVAEGVTNASSAGGTLKLSTSSDPTATKLKYALR
jgi:trimeric autotransporter adhesin